MKATPREREHAQCVAQLMRSYDDLWQQAASATGSESEWERFYEQMDALASVIELHVSLFGNRARFLQLVAEVLNGKNLRGAPHDDVILQAVKTAIKKRRRKNRSLTEILVSVEGRQKTMAFAVPNPLIARFIIGLCSQVADPSNLSGDKLTVTFKE